MWRRLKQRPCGEIGSGTGERIRGVEMREMPRGRVAQTQLAMVILCFGIARTAAAQDESPPDASSPTPFSRLPLWDDGLSEMSYYDATESLYGIDREYTRVHLMNRQWMGGESGVKADPADIDAVPVFKFVIAEEIPTQNYNYRFLTTAFVRRDDLSPFKISCSSQEWCGHTFKQLRWSEKNLTVQSFSYFADEGDRTWELGADAVPYESLFILARAAVAGQTTPPERLVLAGLRSNHQVVPRPISARLEIERNPKRVTVPIGSFAARRVSLKWNGPRTWFDVEDAPPWRVLAFENGTARGQLRFVERRAYWDRKWSSGFHRSGDAP